MHNSPHHQSEHGSGIFLPNSTLISFSGIMEGSDSSSPASSVISVVYRGDLKSVVSMPSPRRTDRRPPIAQRACNYCALEHVSMICPELMQLPSRARLDKIRRSGRCTNCLGNHQLGRCNSQKGCRDCGERHHTILHRILGQPSASSSSRLQPQRDRRNPPKATREASPPRSAVKARSRTALILRMQQRAPGFACRAQSTAAAQNTPGAGRSADPAQFEDAREQPRLLPSQLYRQPSPKPLIVPEEMPRREVLEDFRVVHVTRRPIVALEAPFVHYQNLPAGVAQNCFCAECRN